MRQGMDYGGTFPYLPETTTGLLTRPVAELSENLHFRPNGDEWDVADDGFVEGETLDDDGNPRHMRAALTPEASTQLDRAIAWSNVVSGGQANYLHIQQPVMYFPEHGVAYYDETERKALDTADSWMYLAQVCASLCELAPKTEGQQQAEYYRDRMDKLRPVLIGTSFDESDLQAFDAILSNEKLLNHIQPGFIHGSVDPNSLGCTFTENEDEGYFTLPAPTHPIFPNEGEGSRPRLQDVADIYMGYMVDQGQPDVAKKFIDMCSLSVRAADGTHLFPTHSSFLAELHLSVLERSLTKLDASPETSEQYAELARSSLRYMALL